MNQSNIAINHLKSKVMLVALVLAVCGVLRLAVGAGAPGADKDAAERAKWDKKIEFYTEEGTDEWSLRILDRLNPEPATVRYTELWKYDVQTKKWIKIDDGAPAARIVAVKDKPANSPADSQIIAVLPIQPNTVGLFYGKWKVNDTVEGAAFGRIGPGVVGAAQKAALEHPPKVPQGSMWTPVPISLNKAEYQVIPDPRFNTGQPMKKVPASQPAGK